MISVLAIAMILAGFLGLGLAAGLGFRKMMSSREVTAGHQHTGTIGCLAFLILLPLGVWILFNRPDPTHDVDQWNDARETILNSGD